ncbi:reverse transcriptase domain protein [Colletotrichum kahawae]|uniref:Reverse transcriptase domain protein n=1 Tax=Colletotrichum kahawae TaxID=34407 RepID=A0AAD9YMT0_COLKA|nr:reverse transcriptase domain protein [Colletotrichum kahawae]
MENLRIQTLSSDEDWNKWLPNLKLVARTRIQYNREIDRYEKRKKALNTYGDIMEEIKQAKITALSDPYQQTADFLRAIRSISPEYYTQVTLEITRKEFTEQEYKENNAGINRANEFRKWLRTANPELLSNNASKSASFATWQGEDEKSRPTQSPTSGLSEQTTRPTKTIPVSIRGSDYNPDSMANKQAIQKAKKMITLAIQKAIKRENKKHGRTYIELKEEEDNKAQQQSSFFTKQREQSESDCCSQATFDSSFVNMSKTTDVSLFSGYPLRDSVIIDSGSDNHICNDLYRMRDVDFSVKEKVLTGGGEACIQGVGSMLIRPNGDMKTACQTGKAKRRVSRRAADHQPTAPGDYLSLDFFGLNNAYNNLKMVLLLKDVWSGFIWVRMLKNRKQGLEAISHIIAFLERQYGIKVTVLRLDWETALRNAFDL